MSFTLIAVAVAENLEPFQPSIHMLDANPDSGKCRVDTLLLFG